MVVYTIAIKYRISPTLWYIRLLFLSESFSPKGRFDPMKLNLAGRHTRNLFFQNLFNEAWYSFVSLNVLSTFYILTNDVNVIQAPFERRKKSSFLHFGLNVWSANYDNIMVIQNTSGRKYFYPKKRCVWVIRNFEFDKEL